MNRVPSNKKRGKYGLLKWILLRPKVTGKVRHPKKPKKKEE